MISICRGGREAEHAPRCGNVTNALQVAITRRHILSVSKYARRQIQVKIKSSATRLSIHHLLAMSNNAPTVTQRRSSQRSQERRSSSNVQDAPHSHSPSSSKSSQQHSESDSSSFPDISEVAGKENQSTSLGSEDEGVEDEDEVKAEEGDDMDVEELSHSDVRGDAGPVRLSDSASATLSSQGAPNHYQLSTPTASLKPAKPTPKKRRREDVDEVIELPQVSASQPPSYVVR